MTPPTSEVADRNDAPKAASTAASPADQAAQLEQLLRNSVELERKVDKSGSTNAMKLQDDIKGFLTNAAGSRLTGPLERFNANKFDKNDVKGLDEEEFRAFEASINSAVNYIVQMGDIEKFKVADADANSSIINNWSLKSMVESMASGGHLTDAALRMLTSMSKEQLEQYYNARPGLNGTFAAGVFFRALTVAPSMIEDIAYLAADVVESPLIVTKYLKCKVLNWLPGEMGARNEMELDVMAKAHPLIGLFQLVASEKGWSAIGGMVSALASPDQWTAKGMVDTLATVGTLGYGAYSLTTRMSARASEVAANASKVGSTTAETAAATANTTAETAANVATNTTTKAAGTTTTGAESATQVTASSTEAAANTATQTTKISSQSSAELTQSLNGATADVANITKQLSRTETRVAELRESIARMQEKIDGGSVTGRGLAQLKNKLASARKELAKGEEKLIQRTQSLERAQQTEGVVRGKLEAVEKAEAAVTATEQIAAEEAAAAAAEETVAIEANAATEVGNAAKVEAVTSSAANSAEVAAQTLSRATAEVAKVEQAIQATSAKIDKLYADVNKISGDVAYNRINKGEGLVKSIANKANETRLALANRGLAKQREILEGQQAYLAKAKDAERIAKGAADSLKVETVVAGKSAAEVAAMTPEAAAEWAMKAGQEADALAVRISTQAPGVYGQYEGVLKQLGGKLINKSDTLRDTLQIGNNAQDVAMIQKEISRAANDLSKLKQGIREAHPDLAQKVGLVDGETTIAAKAESAVAPKTTEFTNALIERIVGSKKPVEVRIQTGEGVFTDATINFVNGWKSVYEIRPTASGAFEPFSYKPSLMAKAIKEGKVEPITTAEKVANVVTEVAAKAAEAAVKAQAAVKEISDAARAASGVITPRAKGVLDRLIAKAGETAAKLRSSTPAEIAAAEAETTIAVQAAETTLVAEAAVAPTSAARAVINAVLGRVISGGGAILRMVRAVKNMVRATTSVIRENKPLAAGLVTAGRDISGLRGSGISFNVISPAAAETGRPAAGGAAVIDAPKVNRQDGSGDGESVNTAAGDKTPEESTNATELIINLNIDVLTKGENKDALNTALNGRPNIQRGEWINISIDLAKALGITIDEVDGNKEENKNAENNARHENSLSHQFGRKIQELIYGKDNGPFDGEIGKKTVASLREFLRTREIQPNPDAPKKEPPVVTDAATVAEPQPQVAAVEPGSQQNNINVGAIRDAAYQEGRDAAARSYHALLTSRESTVQAADNAASGVLTQSVDSITAGLSNDAEALSNIGNDFDRKFVADAFTALRQSAEQMKAGQEPTYENLLKIQTAIRELKFTENHADGSSILTGENPVRVQLENKFAVLKQAIIAARMARENALRSVSRSAGMST